jgi:transposase
MLTVVVIDAAREGEFEFEYRKFGAMAGELSLLAEWLGQQEVREVVMESTAQYWKPVWRELEERFRLHLAQAQSNRAPKGRKSDFADAERLVRRHMAGELILSFVPDPEQRLWRSMTPTKHQLGRDRVRLHNQIEAFLEDARIKLSSYLSDLLGVSGKTHLTGAGRGRTGCNPFSNVGHARPACHPGTVVRRSECRGHSGGYTSADPRAVFGTVAAN